MIRLKREKRIVNGIFIILTIGFLFCGCGLISGKDYSKHYFIPSVKRIEIIRKYPPYDTCFIANSNDPSGITGHFCSALSKSTLEKTGCPEKQELEWQLIIFGEGPNWETGDKYVTNGKYFHTIKSPFYPNSSGECYKLREKDNFIYRIIQSYCDSIHFLNSHQATY